MECSSATRALRYNGVEIDSQVAVENDAEDNGWTHVMVVNPNVGPFGGSGQLFIDGVAVAARLGGYNGNNDFPLVIGASNGAFDPAISVPDPIFAGGNADFFAGTLDNMNMFVLGKSISGMDYGSFNLAEYNEYVTNELTTYGDGDVTGDGAATDSDVTIFIANWGAQNLVNDIPVGDLNSRLAGDFNLDGTIGLSDWEILVENYTGSASLNLSQLLTTQSVPEPSTAILALLVAGVVGLAYQRRV